MSENQREVSRLTEEELKAVQAYNKMKTRQRRQTAKDRILIMKARTAGIVVTEEDIEKYLAGLREF